jgi:hypothetical protein
MLFRLLAMLSAALGHAFSEDFREHEMIRDVDSSEEWQEKSRPHC